MTGGGGLVTLIVTATAAAAGAPRLPAVCGGRAPGENQEAGQERQVDVHPHRQAQQQQQSLLHLYCKVLDSRHVDMNRQKHNVFTVLQS